MASEGHNFVKIDDWLKKLKGCLKIMENQFKVNEQMKTAKERREQNGKSNKVCGSRALVMKTCDMIRMVNMWSLLLVTKVINGKNANTTNKAAIIVDVTRKNTLKIYKRQQLIQRRMLRK